MSQCMPIQAAPLTLTLMVGVGMALWPQKEVAIESEVAALFTKPYEGPYHGFDSDDSFRMKKIPQAVKVCSHLTSFSPFY